MNPNDSQGNAQLEAGLQSIAAAIIGQKTVTKSNGAAPTSSQVLAGAKIVVGYFYVTLSAQQANGGNCNFPAGSFSAPPIVVANLAGVAPGSGESGTDAGETCTVSTVTKDSFRVWVRNTASNVTATFAVQYIAIGV